MDVKKWRFAESLPVCVDFFRSRVCADLSDLESYLFPIRHAFKSFVEPFSLFSINNSIFSSAIRKHFSMKEHEVSSLLRGSRLKNAFSCKIINLIWFLKFTSSFTLVRPTKEFRFSRRTWWKWKVLHPQKLFRFRAAHVVVFGEFTWRSDEI